MKMEDRDLYRYSIRYGGHLVQIFHHAKSVGELKSFINDDSDPWLKCYVLLQANKSEFGTHYIKKSEILAFDDIFGDQPYEPPELKSMTHNNKKIDGPVIRGNRVMLGQSVSKRNK